MKISPLLIAAAALFWGVESGNVLVSLIIVFLTGSAIQGQVRLNFSDEDFVRVSDLTSVIFLAAIALIVLNVEKVVFLKTLVVWLPMVLLPLIVAQLYSGREKIIIGTRFGFRKRELHKHDPLDFRYYYLAACLFSAAMANSRSIFFFPAAGILLFWLLLDNRSQAFSKSVFISIFVVALGLGFLGFKGAEVVHEHVREKTRMFFRGYFYSKYADPMQSHLSFGLIGRMKSSGDIVLRLTGKGAGPGLLKQASYDLFNSGVWHSNQTFTYLVVSKFGWDLMEPPHPAGQKATIEFYLPKEKGLLPQPYESYRVNGSTLYELEQKADGITRIIDGASLVQYDIFYNPVLIRDNDKPTHRNRVVHPQEDEYLARVVEDWQVEGLSQEERVGVVKHYFENGFSYTLDIEGLSGADSPLENFLLHSKSGYCEQFATATTLLLRKLGVPSRYVTGYVVTEKSQLEKKFIVRERHAHSWSEAYVNDRWVTVDNTPTDWFAKESESRSPLEGIKDVFSYIKLKYDHFRIRTEQNYNQVLSIIIVILAIILIYRIYSRMHAARKVAVEGAGRGKVFDKVESPLYLVEKRLQDLQIPRRSNESFLQWARRIHTTQNIELQTIEGIFRLHLKLRFDPGGLEMQEQQVLGDQVRAWLEKYKWRDSVE
jgi:uncharacterized membrane protein